MVSAKVLLLFLVLCGLLDLMCHMNSKHKVTMKIERAKGS